MLPISSILFPLRVATMNIENNIKRALNLENVNIELRQNVSILKLTNVDSANNNPFSRMEFPFLILPFCIN